MKRGDFVWIERDGRRIRGMILLAAENENSLMVMFDGTFFGYVSMLPLLREDGEYRDLIQGQPVTVEVCG